VGDSVIITITENIQSEVTLGDDIINYDDYRISFDIYITKSPLYLSGIEIVWDDKNAMLDNIIIYSPSYEDVPNNINAGGKTSPYSNYTIEDILGIGTEEKTTIHLYYSKVKIVGDSITVTLIDDDIEYPLPTFEVPNN
jgi:hypothetical protein